MKIKKGKVKTETILLVASVFLALSLIVVSALLMSFLGKKLQGASETEEVAEDASVKFDIKGYEALGIGEGI